MKKLQKRKKRPEPNPAQELTDFLDKWAEKNALDSVAAIEFLAAEIVNFAAALEETLEEMQEDQWDGET